MIITNKTNLSVFTIHKQPDSPPTPKVAYVNLHLCLALEGSAVWEIEETRYNIEPGDVIFLTAAQKRRFIAFGSDGFKLCAFALTRSAIQGLHYFSFFIQQAKTDPILKNCSLAPILRELYDVYQSESPYRYEFASAKFTEFFVKSFLKVPPSCTTDPHLTTLMDEIDAQAVLGLDLRSAAQKAGMSESTFSRRFSRINGMSFKRYVMERKIQHAISLLQNTNKKMIDIACESGFDSLSGFYNTFKKITGTTPSKFSFPSL